MGLFGRRKKEPDIPTPEEWQADPSAALKRALGNTDTYEDEHGRRRKITPEMRAQMESSIPPGSKVTPPPEE